MKTRRWSACTAHAFLSCLTLFMLACGESRSPQPPPDRQPENAPSARFAITEPKSRTEVDRNEIVVRGVGAQPGDSIKVEVLTDNWYLQTGRYDLGSGGSWTFAPCYL